MPVDRRLAEDLAETIRDLYSSAEQRLVADIAARLRSGLDRADWAERKLEQVSRVRIAAERVAARLDSKVGDQVEQLLTLAYIRGGEAGLDELARLGRLDADQVAAIRRELPGTAAIQRLAFSLASTLRGTHLRITRWALDVYREVVSRASTGTLAGVDTRLRTAQRAWEQLLSRGITGFVDRSGRAWELASYTEMATRTVAAQAAVEGHLDRLAAAGLDLVIVSNAPQECSRCRPYEGAVLTRRGPGGRRTIEVEHATRVGVMTRVEVTGSVDEAIADGLLHPNCRLPVTACPPTCPAPLSAPQRPPTRRATRPGRSSAGSSGRSGSGSGVRPAPWATTPQPQPVPRYGRTRPASANTSLTPAYTASGTANRSAPPASHPTAGVRATSREVAASIQRGHRP